MNSRVLGRRRHAAGGRRRAAPQRNRLQVARGAARSGGGAPGVGVDVEAVGGRGGDGRRRGGGDVVEGEVLHRVQPRVTVVLVVDL